MTGRARTIAAVLLAWALLLGACDGGGDDAGDADAGDVGTTAQEGDGGDDASDIAIEDFTFTPSVLEIETGTTVEATNEDGVAHTWTADDGAFDSGELAAGESATHRFDEAGTFPYHCAIHPNMTGTVEVSA